jgi:hypothetical protein
MSELLLNFRRLFDGRTDIVGNGENPANPFRPSPERPLIEYFEDHLQGKKSIGVYPQIETNMVKWGCVDFDEGYDESWPDAVNVYRVLQEFGVTSWCEKTRTKGWHVWVFLDWWTSAKTVREALLAACQLVSAPTKEINPKQAELTEEKPYGNYVRLPYPGGGRPDRQVVVAAARGDRLDIAEFVPAALYSRVTASQLHPLQDLWVPPAPKFTPEPYDYKQASSFPPLIQHVLNQPPNTPAQGGRSSTMQRIAHLCRREGLDYEDTRLAVWAYDEIWGKYKGRPDRDQRIREIVDRAF